MSAQHTPRPWATYFLNKWPDDIVVRSMFPDGTEPQVAVTNADNARLIAAAPEMLAALQAVLAEIEGPDRPHSTDSWLPSHLAHQVRVAVANAMMEARQS